jgi:hypothetical protein
MRLDQPLRDEEHRTTVDARLIPLLVAAVGVAGGVGGAFVGGKMANEGQEKQSESERAAAKQALRVDAYADYLGSAEALVGKLSLDFSENEREEALIQLLADEARAVIVAGRAKVIQQEADEVTKAVSNQDEDAYNKAATAFFHAARDDIEAAEK